MRMGKALGLDGALAVKPVYVESITGGTFGLYVPTAGWA